MRSETFKSLVSKPVHDFYGRELGKIIGIYVDNLGQLKSVGVDEGHGNLKEYSSTNIVFEEGSLVIVPKLSAPPCSKLISNKIPSPFFKFNLLNLNFL